MISAKELMDRYRNCQWQIGRLRARAEELLDEPDAAEEHRSLLLRLKLLHVVERIFRRRLENLDGRGTPPVSRN